MEIMEVENRTQDLIKKLVSVWEYSVKETHLFLSDKEIEQIKQYVPQAIADVPHLFVAKNEAGNPLAFMGIDGQKLEMLFVAADLRGRGIGKKLIQIAVKNYCINEVTVNEQNPLARAFYEHIGFEVYKRTDEDEQGNPYPLLYMKLDSLRENIK